MTKFKRSGLCVTVFLAACLGARAAETNQRLTPQGAIAGRNMFDLKPAPPERPPTDRTPPLPQIILRGFMTVFGSEQVLFEVDQSAGGQPTRKSYFVLGEGEAQDGFAVLRIEKSGAVIFQNHGVLQRIPFQSAAL